MNELEGILKNSEFKHYWDASREDKYANDHEMACC